MKLALFKTTLVLAVVLLGLAMPATPDGDEVVLYCHQGIQGSWPSHYVIINRAEGSVRFNYSEGGAWEGPAAHRKGAL